MSSWSGYQTPGIGGGIGGYEYQQFSLPKLGSNLPGNLQFGSNQNTQDTGFKPWTSENLPTTAAPAPPPAATTTPAQEAIAQQLAYDKPSWNNYINNYLNAAQTSVAQSPQGGYGRVSYWRPYQDFSSGARSPLNIDAYNAQLASGSASPVQPTQSTTGGLTSAGTTGGTTQRARLSLAGSPAGWLV